MNNYTQQRIISADSIFSNRLLESKPFYMYRFNAIPSVNMVFNIDGRRALKAFRETFAAGIQHTYQYATLQHKQKQYECHITLMVMHHHCMVEFGETYCEILHNGQAAGFIEAVTTLLKKYRKRVQHKKNNISLITDDGHGLELSNMEIKKTRLDLNLYYEDDFAAIDATIQKRLNKQNDKGIVLLHGLPGTGKTTYLRYLLGRLKKRVLFVSPGMAGNITQPGFIDLLIENPNSILVIEDAENIIMDRKLTGKSTVSNLLNLSDGLLADCLNVQVICTFNSDLSMIDSALLRKGRLIAQYEFGRLSVPKAQQLSRHLGFDTDIYQPMSIAEIANQHEKSFEKKASLIGFRAN
ncbi:MAG TPA: AAA family ATPase [Chitinophaga sp.]|uniref:AAA family ATPase n=1 Tax=Chitinophaga sp. TaxID=1869181 RepID=UPI002DB8851D|nr:AAA family ATPase [Chitinophaga sp.]HEU4551756.1 AAA family ATPase [Chitinophaga sp.]